MSTTAARPPSFSTTSAIDAALDFLWRKFGPWLMLVFISFGWLLGLCACTVGALAIANVAQLPPGQTFDLVLALAAAELICWLVSVGLSVTQIRLWANTARSQAAHELGAATASFVTRTFRTNVVIAYGLQAPMIGGAIMAYADPDIAMFLAFVLALLVIVTFFMALVAFMAPFMIRYLLRGIGQVGIRSIGPIRPGGFQRRLMIAIPTVGMLAATAGVGFGASPGTNGADLLRHFLFAIALVGVFAFPAAFLLFYSTVRPLQDLIAGTDRVKRGQLYEAVPELSFDEFGVLARSFNEMMDGLADRERLAVEVRESRSRIVAAADESRKRIERNIHDGAQQRLVALALDVRLLEEQAPTLSAAELAAAHRRISDDLKAALSELRELARGLHPSVLATDGLGPAVEQLASRSSIPVAVEVTEGRFPEAVETACYFTVAEALANVAKYAEANEAAVRIEQQDGHVRLQVSDNGVGGADPKAGSGLTGLIDRIAALDGTLTVDSPAGVGTTLTVELPLAKEVSA